MTTIAREPSAARMSADAVRTATFSRRRRGCDEDEVREFLHKLARQIQAADAERASLRAEVFRLREDVAGKETAEPQPTDLRVEVSVHAVSLLSQAQQAADTAVAEAEQYARDLVTAARNQYQEILERAQESAAEAVRELPVIEASGGYDYSAAVPEIEYVRTFAQVAQVQLRSVLEALAAEVDRLGQLPHLDQRPHAARTTETSWRPATIPDPRGA